MTGTGGPVIALPIFHRGAEGEASRLGGSKASISSHGQHRATAGLVACCL
jgi:hypothetical protein